MTAIVTTDMLSRAGLGDDAADRVARLFARAGSALSVSANNEDAAAFWVPGRIEFLGKHTDYAGGRSLVCAVDRGIALVARRRSDAMVHVVDAVSGETGAVSLDSELVVPAGDWRGYVVAVARRVARNFPGACTGVDIAFASDLPAAAGMSSSSALVIAAYLALEWANALADRDDYRRELPTTEALAEYLGSIESGRSFGALVGDRGIGTLSGSQDQAAILLGRAGSLARFAFCPLRYEGLVPLPAAHVFAVASSGVRAEKSAAAQEQYNAVARKAAAAADLWRRATGFTDATLGDIVAKDDGSVDRLRSIVRDTPSTAFTAAELLARVDQFVAETTEIIPATAGALAAGNLAAVGPLVARSFDEADRGLRNQIAETRWLVQAMADDAVAASAFGAGFGGSVWALVPSHGAEAVVTRWRDRYLSAFPQHRATAEFFLTAAGPAARRLA